MWAGETALAPGGSAIHYGYGRTPVGTASIREAAMPIAEWLDRNIGRIVWAVIGLVGVVLAVIAL